ncbi:MAG: proton-conducting transporter transmembrane domain-containing protein [Acidimicrobiales bacterium]
MTADWLWAAAAAWVLAALLGLGSTRRPWVWASAPSSAAGGLAALVGGVMLAMSGAATSTLRAAGSTTGSLVLRATPLSAAFVVLLGLVALAIGCYAPRYHRPGVGTAVYLLVLNAALLASLAVLVAANVTTFLVAWESMTLASGLLVLRRQRERGVGAGAFLFLALGEIGFAMVVAAFVIMATQCHSLDLATIAARAGSVPLAWRSTAFVLALVGFGFKAGLVPFHVWLPVAHPLAPADGSAFLSGLVVKLGVYGIVLFGFELLGRGPSWWGLVAMGLGALSALIGILYGVLEPDLKRFLAFSTVENVGVIVTAAGAGMTFASYGRQTLGAFLLAVALYHVVNHGAYKTLLFLEAGVIEHAAGTRDLNRLGGLVHRMPATSVITLIGTLGIAALPPLNGFVSEWLVFQGLFQGFRLPGHLPGALIVLAAATLALTAGIAVMAFARTFGVGFLGMARSPEAGRASEAGQPVVGPGILAVACMALGVGAPAVLVALDHVVRSVTGVQLHRVLLLPNLTIIPAHTDFSAFSPTYLAVFLVAVLAVPIAIYLAGRSRGDVTKVPVWDGGIVSFRSRMQYTSTTFANPMRVTFDRFYRPNVKVDRASEDPAGSSGPVHYRVEVLPVFERFLYQPVVRLVRRLARVLEPIQSGDVNWYLLYILAAVVGSYLAAAH